MAKRIAVIGRGTAGCLTLAYWRYHGYNIDWYYSSNINPTPVGEGTTPNFTRFIATHLNMGCRDIHSFDGTPKLGINYRNWGDNKPDWVQYFGPNEYGIHFNASKFQDRVFYIAERTPHIKTIDEIVNPEDLGDYDIVLCCTGKQHSNPEDYTPRSYIPVNAVHVTQCYRTKRLESSFTETIAMKWGWVFVVPLQNRASIGYLYNKDITSLESVKEDVQNVFEEYNLTPSTNTNSFTFSNYAKKDLIKGNIHYNGNAAFFLEPLEATTLDCSFRLMENHHNSFIGKLSNKDSTNNFKATLDDIELFIMMRYAGGSKHKTEFWDFAQSRALKCYEAAPNNRKALYTIKK